MQQILPIKYLYISPSNNHAKQVAKVNKNGSVSKKQFYLNYNGKFARINNAQGKCLNIYTGNMAQILLNLAKDGYKELQ